MAASSILCRDGVVLSLFCFLFGSNGKVFNYYIHEKVKVKFAQSCLTLCDPMDLYSPWNSPSQKTRVGRHSLLQGIFPAIIFHNFN